MNARLTENSVATPSRRRVYERRQRILGSELNKVENQDADLGPIFGVIGKVQIGTDLRASALPTGADNKQAAPRALK